MYTPVENIVEMTTAKKNKKTKILSNMFFGLLLLATIIMVVKPEAKAWAIRGLMKVGLFTANVPNRVQKNIKVVDKPTADILFVNEAKEVISLSSLKGKVVFINFWATWCPPCIAEMPSIDKLHNQFKTNDQIVFLMVDVDNNFRRARKFMDKNGYGLSVFAAGSEIPASFLDKTIPSTVILDKQGHVALHHVGGANYADTEMVDFIEKLVESK
ncbi:MAG TPA: TlpA disulfide reductase family protein [Pseudosphingobacterium sp.]|nr:TlpA disulfide reductase family protein [Pseudosphingobacterium sp.]